MDAMKMPFLRYRGSFYHIIQSFTIMKRKIFVVVLCAMFCVGLLFSSCSKKADYELGVGEIVTIKLDANISTGYDWTCNDFGTSKCVRINNQYVEQQEYGPGKPSWHCFVIEGVKKGYTHLKFTHQQSFSNEIAETKIISFVVK